MVVDDQTTLRESLSRVLDADSRLRVVGEACHGEDALSQLGVLRPDVVLMDVQMPVLDGLETTRRIKARLRAPKVIMLTMFDDPDILPDAIRAGADGHLLKEAHTRQVIDTIVAVHAGHRQILDARIEQTRRRREARRQGGEPSPLTAREMQVARLIAQGLPYQEIARRLRISDKTLKVHTHHICTKLRVHGRTQIAIHAIAAGWVRPKARSARVAASSPRAT
jgi:DNA-binding NarL/FixJ family response regulator